MVNAESEPSTPKPSAFEPAAQYERLLHDGSLPMPIAAVTVLAEVIERSQSSTMQELLDEISRVASDLRREAHNPVSLSAGTALLLRFVTLQRPPPTLSFDAHKRALARLARDFVRRAPELAILIANEAAKFVNDGSTIMTHGFSRVVTKTLIHAANVHRKRFNVLVCESRPFGLGVKTHAVLSKAGIPCTIILDSAVAYSMGRVTAVFLGAEGVAESGGLISGIGSFQMALAAKHFGKQVYALVESYKFLRIYPLSQSDLPTITEPLTRVATEKEQEAAATAPILPTPSRPMRASPMPKALEMTQAQIDDNPLLDFTSPDLISMIISDVAIVRLAIRLGH